MLQTQQIHSLLAKKVGEDHILSERDDQSSATFVIDFEPDSQKKADQLKKKCKKNGHTCESRVEPHFYSDQDPAFGYGEELTLTVTH